MEYVNFQDIFRLEDFIKAIRIGKVYESPVLYRGQNDEWPLVPKILRPWEHNRSEIASVLEREKWLLKEFKRRSVGIDQMPGEDCDWVSKAQHYGLPTRLIDWTQNALAALWFAIDGAKKEQQPTVWRLETLSTDFEDERGTFLDPKNTRVFRPNHVTARIRVQAGWFTVHRIRQGSTYAFENMKRFKGRLTRLKIMCDRQKMLWQLNDIGLNRETLFPDIGSLCKHLEWEMGWIDRLNAPPKVGFIKEED